MIQDLVEKVLIENGRAKVAKAYILYREERARQRAKRGDSDRSPPSGNIPPWPKLWQVLDWSVSHNVHTSKASTNRSEKGTCTIWRQPPKRLIAKMLKMPPI